MPDHLINELLILILARIVLCRVDLFEVAVERAACFFERSTRDGVPLEA
jgi:hypothetical protein